MLQKFFEAWPATARITLAERRLLLRCLLPPSETVRFVSEWRQNGATSAKSQGGDQRSHRIEVPLLRKLNLCHRASSDVVPLGACRFNDACKGRRNLRTH